MNQSDSRPAPDSRPASDARPATGDHPPHRYTAGLANQIEARWQERWSAEQTFRAPNPGEPGFDPSRPKQYILDMFPYPSGVGLHVGHPLGYIATDIYARFLRMTGHNVLHAMGYDAFGLPAEQYAVQTNTHPRVTTERNIATMRAQLRRLGLAHEDRRSVATTDPGFYRWTQWIFLQIYNSWYDAQADGGRGRARPIGELVAQFERGERRVPGEERPWSQLPAKVKRAALDAHRLAYLAEVPVNWCPKLGTVLANEEVIDGKSERGGFPVYRRPLKQWMMRITAYADRLLDDLAPLAWPEPIKLMQRNWIGRSEGAHVDFDCSTRRIRVFTTRPDTLFGATYMVLAPEHELVDQIVTEKYGNPAFTAAIFPGSRGLLDAGASPREVVAAYRRYAAGKSDQDRTEGKDKTGVFTGAYAVNPVNGQRVPVFIADYVLAGYGTGAIMAVPAHDERDFEFAEAFALPIVDVVYDRAALAMRYFCGAATAEEESGPLWRARLADFLGLVTTSHAGESEMAACLHTVRTRRNQDTVPATAPTPARAGQPTRGVVQLSWLEAIDDLKVESLAELRAVFADRRFARQTGGATSGEGFAVNSPPEGVTSNGLSINGLPTADAKRAVAGYLASIGRGGPHVLYKLRDWLFSRQRYWGEPFPIVFDEEGLPHALPESMLPVLLPHVDNFQPESSDDPEAPVRTPLDRAAEWRDATLDLGDGRGPRRFTRETNTMPNWAGSCWYYLRYLDPANERALVDQTVERFWMAGETGGTGVPPVGQQSPGVGAALEKSRRNLPHWQKGGSTYFVTFRVKSGQLSEAERQLVLDACLHWDGQRATVHGVVVMPDHVHVLITPWLREDGEWIPLGELLHSIKSFTAHEIAKSRGDAGPVWLDESFDRIVRDADEFSEKWNYLVKNPVEAGLAAKPGEYRFAALRHRGFPEEHLVRVGRRTGEGRTDGGSPPHRRDAGATGSVATGSVTTSSAATSSAGTGFRAFGGVDLYVGGVEHAVLHLLYARFWHKVLFDLGHVSTPEPFGRLFNQGYIQAFAFKDTRGFYVPAEEVEERADEVTVEVDALDLPSGEREPLRRTTRYFHEGRPVFREYGKMGKSLKNAVSPDTVCAEYGCDTMRVYEMSMGPLEASKPWNTRDIAGAYRFLQRVWRNLVDEQTGVPRVVDAEASADLLRVLHKTIAGVRKDMAGLSFNTAVAKLIEFNNELTRVAGPEGKLPGVPRVVAEPLILMLAPLAPHMAEELWAKVRHGGAAGPSLAFEPFPVADERLAADDQLEIPVQVLGKLRGKITVPAGSDAKALEAAALADEKIQQSLGGKPVKKVIVVPGKLVNLVV